jgi:DNA-binding GntR family transcriptional regulator
LVTGRMRPGVLYSAPRLAEQFGVSATPVREAMLDLVAEGLVEVVRNKGFRVTSLSDSELDAMAELRALIEVPVMGLVAEECTGERAAAVRALRPLARAIREAASGSDLIGYIENDTDFHLAFLALHGNDQVVQVVRELRGRSRLYGLERLANDGLLMRFCDEHDAMIDAALARDRSAMTEVVASHIGHLRSLWAAKVDDVAAVDDLVQTGQVDQARPDEPAG